MKTKFASLAIAGIALMAGAIGTAQARVDVGIGIGLPGFIAPAPVYVAPPPPVYVAPPPPVVYAPPPVVYAPRPVYAPYYGGYYGPGYYGRGYYGPPRGHGHHRHWDRD